MRGDYIEAAAALIGLPLAAADRAEVARYLAIAEGMAAVLEAVPLDPAELAVGPVFRLPDPEEAA